MLPNPSVITYTHHCCTQVSSKLRRILTIWSQGRGVVSLQMFHNTTAEEAFSREACLIEAIGTYM